MNKEEFKALVFYCYESNPDQVLGYLSGIGLPCQTSDDILNGVLHILQDSDELTIDFLKNCHPDYELLQDLVATDGKKPNSSPRNYSDDFYYKIHLKEAGIIAFVIIVGLLIFKK
jgi:hypothetical protein